MKKFETIIFDCDGVLINSEIIANRIEVEVKNELGFPISLSEQLTQFVGLGMSHPLVIEELKRLPADYLEIVETRVHAAYQKDLKPIAGVVETLKQIGFPMCIASSSETDSLKFKLELTGLKPFFGDFLFTGTMVKNCKPAPDLYLLALEKMNWDPKTCLVIEDSLAGVTSAKAAGLFTCGFVGGEHLLPGHADQLKKLGADHIVTQFEDILKLLN